MRNKIIAVLGTLLFTTSIMAQGLEFEWAVGLGGIFDDEGNSITVDDSGNVYTTGYFESTVYFTLENGTFNISSNGGKDIFVSKSDASGNFIWVNAMGGITDWDEGHSIAVDAFGNVYSTGIFRDTVDFDPGSGVHNLSSSLADDFYILKLDASGNFIWAKALGGSNIDYGNSIAIDSSGNVYTTGFFQNTADFDPGSGTYNLSSNGGEDIFISKLDSSGSFVWAKSMGSSSFDNGNSVAVDNAGNVYTTGIFYDTIDFDPNGGTYNLSSNGWQDIFVVKLDPTGNFIWAKKMGSSSSDFGNSIALDASGNVYTTGYFQGPADFDPGSGVSYLSSNGSRDSYISKFSQYLSANFIASDTFISLGDTIQFTDLSSDNPTSWFWDFGNGASDTLQNPTVVYNSVGMFDVELIIGNGVSVDTMLIVEYITVNDSSTTGDIFNIPKPVSKFELFQNHPNPFSYETEISFYLPKNYVVEIEIFNVMGKRIIEQLPEPSLLGKPTAFSQGKHSITFHNNNLASGTYFYRLKTEDFEQTRKMIVLR